MSEEQHLSIIANALFANATSAVLRRFCLELAARVGMNELDGLSVSDWYDREVMKEIHVLLVVSHHRVSPVT
jgi:hypothetical protein